MNDWISNSCRGYLEWLPGKLQPLLQHVFAIQVLACFYVAVNVFYNISIYVRKLVLVHIIVVLTLCDGSQLCCNFQFRCCLEPAELIVQAIGCPSVWMFVKLLLLLQFIGDWLSVCLDVCHIATSPTVYRRLAVRLSGCLSNCYVSYSFCLIFIKLGTCDSRATVQKTGTDF